MTVQLQLSICRSGYAYPRATTYHDSILKQRKTRHTVTDWARQVPVESRASVSEAEAPQAQAKPPVIRIAIGIVSIHLSAKLDTYFLNQTHM